MAARLLCQSHNPVGRVAALDPCGNCSFLDPLVQNLTLICGRFCAVLQPEGEKLGNYYLGSWQLGKLGSNYISEYGQNDVSAAVACDDK